MLGIKGIKELLRAWRFKGYGSRAYGRGLKVFRV